MPDWAVGVLPNGAEFRLEIAASDEERARGYMFREVVGPREGMLFLFTESSRHGFWMKNCRVSLDILWLDENFHIVHIEPSVPPCPEEGECPSVVPFRAGKYVVEFAAGTSAAEELKTGDRIVILADGELP